MCLTTLSGLSCSSAEPLWWRPEGDLFEGDGRLLSFSCPHNNEHSSFQTLMQNGVTLSLRIISGFTRLQLRVPATGKTFEESPKKTGNQVWTLSICFNHWHSQGFSPLRRSCSVITYGWISGLAVNMAVVLFSVRVWNRKKSNILICTFFLCFYFL